MADKETKVYEVRINRSGTAHVRAESKAEARRMIDRAEFVPVSQGYWYPEVSTIKEVRS